MRTVTKQKGFTLMEALIYIALFTVIIGGGIISAYSIFDGTSHIQSLTRKEIELNFVLRKLNWALSGTIDTPPPNQTGSILIVYKDGYKYQIDGISRTLNIRRTSGGHTDAYELTDKWFHLDDLSFEHKTDPNGGPDTILYKLTVDSEPIGPITHYVRTN